ncbi:hypothetical protein ABEB36_013430 [Hypothenemus hampei]|uniref:Uncharacterized protein n=1 Tax=Hypothenemus hampei TaxID=57062 RepID=A0ABD1E805_HYPHA
MPSELDPDAPVFTPPPKPACSRCQSENSTPSASPINVKEPQCSRYSRRSARQALISSPRPILGTKLPFPRPILGRKEEPLRDEADEFIGKEFRNLSRSLHRLKINEETSTAKQKEESLS